MPFIVMIQGAIFLCTVAEQCCLGIFPLILGYLKEINQQLATFSDHPDPDELPSVSLDWQLPYNIAQKVAPCIMTIKGISCLGQSSLEKHLTLASQLLPA